MDGDMIMQTIAQFGAPTLLCFVIFLKGTEKLDALTAQIVNLDKNVVRLENAIERLNASMMNCK